MKNSSGRVRVAKKKFGSGRVAGTRQTLPSNKEETLSSSEITERSRPEYGGV